MKPAFIVFLLVMVIFLTVVTETDSKPVNEYDYVEGAKPVYRKRVQDASRSLDGESCCINCRPGCACCYAIQE